MILAQFIIFMLGWPLEWTEIIIIFMPIFLPLLHALQHRPRCSSACWSRSTPDVVPDAAVAMACFYLKGVAPTHVTLNQIFAGALPFLFMVFVSMFLVYVFPQIAMWLPDRILYR